MLNDVEIGSKIIHNGEECEVIDIQMDEINRIRTVFVASSYQMLVEKLSNPNTNDTEKKLILEELDRRLTEEKDFEEQKISEIAELERTGIRKSFRKNKNDKGSFFSRILTFFSFISCFVPGDNKKKLELKDNDARENSEKKYDEVLDHKSQKDMIFNDETLNHDEKVKLYFAYELLNLAIKRSQNYSFQEINKIVSEYPNLKERITQIFFNIIIKVLSLPVQTHRDEKRLFYVLRHIVFFDFLEISLAPLRQILKIHLKSNNKHIRCAATDAYIKSFTSYIICLTKGEIKSTVVEVFESHIEASRLFADIQNDEESCVRLNFVEKCLNSHQLFHQFLASDYMIYFIMNFLFDQRKLIKIAALKLIDSLIKLNASHPIVTERNNIIDTCIYQSGGGPKRSSKTTCEDEPEKKRDRKVCCPLCKTLLSEKGSVQRHYRFCERFPQIFSTHKISNYTYELLKDCVRTNKWPTTEEAVKDCYELLNANGLQIDEEKHSFYAWKLNNYKHVREALLKVAAAANEYAKRRAPSAHVSNPQNYEDAMKQFLDNVDKENDPLVKRYLISLYSLFYFGKSNAKKARQIHHIIAALLVAICKYVSFKFYFFLKPIEKLFTTTKLDDIIVSTMDSMDCITVVKDQPAIVVDLLEFSSVLTCCSYYLGNEELGEWVQFGNILEKYKTGRNPFLEIGSKILISAIKENMDEKVTILKHTDKIDEQRIVEFRNVIAESLKASGITEEFITEYSLHRLSSQPLNQYINQLMETKEYKQMAVMENQAVQLRFPYLMNPIFDYKKQKDDAVLKSGGLYAADTDGQCESGNPKNTELREMDFSSLSDELLQLDDLDDMPTPLLQDIAKHYSIRQITSSSLLSDEHIKDFLILQLTKINPEKSIHYIDPGYFHSYASKKTYEDKIQSVRGYGPASHENISLLFYPIGFSNHWVGYVVDIDKKKYYYYDPFGAEDTILFSDYNDIRGSIGYSKFRESLVFMMQHGLHVNDWKSYTYIHFKPISTMRQKGGDGINCGVYLVTFFVYCLMGIFAVENSKFNVNNQRSIMMKIFEEILKRFPQKNEEKKSTVEKNVEFDADKEVEIIEEKIVNNGPFASSSTTMTKDSGNVFEVSFARKSFGVSDSEGRLAINGSKGSLYDTEGNKISSFEMTRDLITAIYSLQGVTIEGYDIFPFNQLQSKTISPDFDHDFNNSFENSFNDMNDSMNDTNISDKQTLDHDFTTGIQSQNTLSQSSETGVPFSTTVENFCINFDPSQGSKEFNSKGKQWNEARYLKAFGAYLRFKTAGGGHSCFCPLCFTRNVEVKLIAHLNDHHCNGPENFNQEDLCNDCLTPVKRSMLQKHQKVCFKRYFKDLLRILLREIDNGRNAFEVWNQLIQSRDD